MKNAILEVQQILEENQIHLTSYQWELLEKWESLLLQQNQKYNLISRKDIEHLWKKHILHSLAILVIRDIPTNSEICDLGTGGGLPGIPLAIACPQNQIIMMDSTQKKIKAVEDIISALSIKNAQAVHGRAEIISQQKPFKHRFSIIVARAVSSLSSIEKWTRDLRAPQSVIHAYKGGDLAWEIEEVSKVNRIKRIEETLLDLKGGTTFVHDQKKIVSLFFT